MTCYSKDGVFNEGFYENGKFKLIKKDIRSYNPNVHKKAMKVDFNKYYIKWKKIYTKILYFRLLLINILGLFFYKKEKIAKFYYKFILNISKASSGSWFSCSAKDTKVLYNISV